MQVSGNNHNVPSLKSIMHSLPNDSAKTEHASSTTYYTLPCRPVTLIGYSMGARLVYHCLLELCRFNCKGIVEHAVMLGCTVTIVKERYTMARSVVSGRFVNAYSSQDWILGLLFRSTSGFIRPAAGLCPVDVAGVENADLSEVVKGHFDYIKKMDTIVKQLGFGLEAMEMQ